jgi:hypothetical protein
MAFLACAAKSSPPSLTFASALGRGMLPRGGAPVYLRLRLAPPSAAAPRPAVLRLQGAEPAEQHRRSTASSEGGAGPAGVAAAGAAVGARLVKFYFGANHNYWDTSRL